VAAGAILATEKPKGKPCHLRAASYPTPKLTHPRLDMGPRRAIGVITRGEASIRSSAECEEFGKEIARLLAAPIFSYAVTYKHPAYAHEKETRLLLANDSSFR
jgi:hypothetical protein